MKLAKREKLSLIVELGLVVLFTIWMVVANNITHSEWTGMALVEQMFSHNSAGRPN